jgi:cytochrome b involved in lipid metabolism
MKKYLILILIVILTGIPFIYPNRLFAQDSYTYEQIAQHNSPSDCWMAIDDKVYDLSTYLPQHDRELNIRSWCGTDASKDYNDKNGKDIDHSIKADNLLKKYLIGNLNTQNTQEKSDISVESAKAGVSKSVSNNSGYNLYLPLFLTIIIYLISSKFLQKRIHIFIWNSVMLLGLIPSFGFGVLMILAKQISWLDSFRNYQILYNHVELSIVFGTVCLLHFLFRLRIYLLQAKNIYNKS